MARVSYGRTWTLMAMSAVVFSHSSCKRSEKESEAAAEETKAPAKVENKTPVQKEDATAPLSPSALQRVSKMGALVQIPGRPGSQGILLEGARGDSSNRNYLVICETPADLASVGVACADSGGLVKAFAKRISTLPSGLSLYGFSSKSSLTCGRLTDPVPGETFHAIRLKGEGSISPEEVAALNAELETIRKQIDESQKQRMEAMRGPRERMRPGVDPRERQQAMMRESATRRTELTSLAARQSEINARLKIPITSIAAVEVRAAAGRETLETAAGELDNSLLATSSGVIRSIRFKGKWLDLQEIVASSGDAIESVKLDLSGGGESAYVSCQLTPTLPSADNSYSMVAVTTFELESQGSGSLEERLAAVKPVPFQGGGGALTAARQMVWNGRKTKLWLKVFNDKDPAKLILDEVILLDYPGSFSARWGKPPSPLIALPAVEPDTPEDLVKERLSIDAKGEIRDLIPAGDGSVVMVQTNQPPYWAPLDLKSGQWMSQPWKATADTLVATQAGKVYLIDRKTKILEVWGLLSGKREDMQLLPLQDMITAAAAPLSDAEQPLMVTTDKNGYFLDPVKFEVIPSNLNLWHYLNAEAGKRQGQKPLDPATLALRASDDGALYSFSGAFDSGTRKSTTNVILTVDRSAMVVVKSNQNQFLATRGRNMSRGFPDHGGSATSIMASRSGGRFPGSPGEIRFADAKGRDGFAIMKNPPVMPDRPEESSGYLVSDRGVYLDSSMGAMLLPDGDKLHLVRLNLPELEKMPPQFLFAGETFEIPLPAGTGHKLVSENGGDSVIGPASIRWTAPVSNEGGRDFALKLEWTSELGSQISKDYRIMVHQTSRAPEAVSADGGRSIPLRRRCVLSEVDSSIVGFAGSGSVVLVNESGALSAWNLVTGELVLRVKEHFNRVLGDADRIYLTGNNGNLTSYDLRTGEAVDRMEPGNKMNSITTGMSSRDSLLAVEQEGVEGFLTQVSRDGLKPVIMELPKETRSRLFIPQLASNASGSTAWSRGVAIFRDRRAITVKPFAEEIVNGVINGVPDASGRFIVSKDMILNIGASPPTALKISTMPGMESSSQCTLEESGGYILLSAGREETSNKTVSLREVAKPSSELLKIRYTSGRYDQVPRIISGTNTLIQWQNAGGMMIATVYDFDVVELTKKLSR